MRLPRFALRAPARSHTGWPPGPLARRFKRIGSSGPGAHVLNPGTERVGTRDRRPARVSGRPHKPRDGIGAPASCGGKGSVGAARDPGGERGPAPAYPQRLRCEARDATPPWVTQPANPLCDPAARVPGWPGRAITDAQGRDRDCCYRQWSACSFPWLTKPQARGCVHVVRAFPDANCWCWQAAVLVAWLGERPRAVLRPGPGSRTDSCGLSRPHRPALARVVLGLIHCSSVKTAVPPPPAGR